MKVIMMVGILVLGSFSAYANNSNCALKVNRDFFNGSQRKELSKFYTLEDRIEKANYLFIISGSSNGETASVGLVEVINGEPGLLTAKTKYIPSLTWGDYSESAIETFHNEALDALIKISSSVCSR